jgi:arylsulfatase
MKTVDGKNISGLLEGETGEVRNIAVTEFAWSKSIRKGKYRMIFYPREMFAEEYPQGFGELYDLEKDPWEMNNLYFNPEFSKKINEITRDLAEWLILTDRSKTALPWIHKEGEGWKTRYKNSVAEDGRIGYNEIKVNRKGNYI